MMHDLRVAKDPCARHHQSSAAVHPSARCRLPAACHHLRPRPVQRCSPIGRYYDPGTGQFISVDPLVDLTGLPYSYTGGNPVNGVDPTGMCVRFLGICWGGGAETSSVAFGWNPGNAWKGLKSFSAGFTNAGLWAISGGQLGAPAPYCEGLLTLSYYIGTGTAVTEAALASVGAFARSGPVLDELSASGTQPDPADAGGQLTRAGRAFAKAGEVFGRTSGNPAAINEAGQNALDQIIYNPGSTLEKVDTGRFAGGWKLVSPEGVGAVFSRDGIIQYFGRM